MVSPIIDGNPRRAPVTLEWRKDTLIKYQDPEQSQVECFKAQRGAEIGKRTGHFATPRILEHDPDYGSIAFERLQGYVHLSDVLTRGPIPNDLMVRVGQSLAEIHKYLNLPKSMMSPVTDLGVALKSPPVFIHGDYSGKNILYSAKADRLMIVDWSIASWLDGGGTFGPRYVDLSIQIKSLFIRTIFARRPRKDPIQLAHDFLDGYRQEASDEFVCDDLKRYFPRLLAISLGRHRNIGFRSRLRLLASLFTVPQVKNFVNSL